ncbi:MAG: hypothetical protein ACRC0A_01680 [Chitinophagaceae bacterium]
MQIVMLVIVVVCTITNVCLIFVQMNLRKKNKDLKNGFEAIDSLLSETMEQVRYKRLFDFCTNEFKEEK